MIEITILSHIIDKISFMFSHSFQVNAVKMMVSLPAYNVTNWLRTIAFPSEHKNMQIDSIRTRLLK